MLTLPQSKFNGPSRRAISFFPGEEHSQPRLSKKDNNLLKDKSFTIGKHLPLLPQLLKIESNQLSGCLKIESERHKSRSALLVERGRGIACVHGSKGQSYQLFGRQAYDQMLLDLALPSTVVSGYSLSDDIVSAAASMFHGGAFNATMGDDAERSLQLAFEVLDKTRGAGSVVLQDQTGMPVCVLYVAGNKIISSKILVESLHRSRSLSHYLKRHPQTRVLVNSLAFHHYDQQEMTFALLRLDHNYAATAAAEARGRQAARLVPMAQLKPVAAPSATRMDRFIRKSQKNLAVRLNHLQAYAHPYRIDPAVGLAALLH